MRFISKTSSGGVAEQLFTLGEIPGVLWTPEDSCERVARAMAKPVRARAHEAVQQDQRPARPGLAVRELHAVMAGELGNVHSVPDPRRGALRAQRPAAEQRCLTGQCRSPGPGTLR